MRLLIQHLERMLLLDPSMGNSRLMRARAVYAMGLCFIFTQFINQVTMYLSYGHFTFDHVTSIAACILVFMTIFTLRVYKNFSVYAAIYSTLIVIGVMAVSLPENTGINSAMLPFFVLGIVMNGFVSGWRAAIIFGVISVGIIWFLWSWSALYPVAAIFDVENFHIRNFQRAMQATLAIIMITSIASVFAYNMHKAFFELEDGIMRAEEDDRAKTEFLATMSHELRTPMNGILGMSDLLLESALDRDQRDLAEMINSSGEELQDIISNVLLFSQLESGKVVLDHEPFAPTTALNAALLPHQIAAGVKGLRLRTDIGPYVPARLMGDADRLQTVIAALVKNAVTYTRSGEVVVRLRFDAKGAVADDAPGHLTVSVADTGRGISKSDQDRIFTRFTQVDSSITREHDGTGLGLTIAQGLAHLMGGTITLNSTLGEGSVFTLRVPLSAVSGDMQVSAVDIASTARAA